MKIHILAICGSKTTPLAVYLKQQGHQVSGSDQEKIYPPFSKILSQNNIPINTAVIDNTIDLVIVGNSYKYFKKCLGEFDQVKKLSVPYVSYTEYLVKNLIKPNSILIAGSYAKTTITGLLSYVFTKLDFDPSYMVAGDLVNQIPSIRFGQSNWSIVEADENHNGLDTNTTFLYYPVKFLILTSTAWEHKDSYPTKEANLKAYRQLIANIPKNGILVYNQNDPDIQKILPAANCPTYPYHQQKFDSQLIGDYNQQNITAVLTLCQKLGFDETKVSQSISTFTGIKRRLEVVKRTNDNIFIDDFAQSPQRIEAAVNAVHQSFPNMEIVVYFEPHASFLQQKSSLVGFQKAFAQCRQVIVGHITFSTKIPKENRATARDYYREIGDKCTYIPINQQVVSYLRDTLKPNQILIHFSSGGLDGLQTFQQIINHFS